MHTGKLFVIRGISGCGKSTLASTLSKDETRICEADKYFINEGTYEFDGAMLPQAHAWCNAQVKDALEDGTGLNVVVSNTFIQRWEMESYLRMAECLNVQVTVISLYDGGCTDNELFGRNAHGVPLTSIARMRASYEHDWKIGNPLPPWERE